MALAPWLVPRACTTPVEASSLLSQELNSKKQQKELEVERVRAEIERREGLSEQLKETQIKSDRLFKEAQEHRDEERPLHEQASHRRNGRWHGDSGRC